MKINRSDVKIQASSFQKSSKIEKRSLEIWGGKGAEADRIRLNGIKQADKLTEAVKELANEYDLLNKEEVESLQNIEGDLVERLLSDTDKLRIRLIEVFMSSWLGYDFKMDKMGFYMSDLGGLDRTRHGWGIRYNHYEEEEKEQDLELEAKGTLILQDGRKINIDYHLHMTEKIHKTIMTRFDAGDAVIDPIVINYDGPCTKLTNEKYAFDIDMDGKKDQISFATKGAGFLALDRNNNGQIDDGSELFGPSSNDGFSELRAYDEDGNGWIDENDHIFDQLLIWERTSDASSKLMSLGETGIGAIYLKDVASLFDFSNNESELQGKMRSSSIFIKMAV